LSESSRKVEKSDGIVVAEAKDHRRNPNGEHPSVEELNYIGVQAEAYMITELWPFDATSQAGSRHG
jgi:hypothetical protein